MKARLELCMRRLRSFRGSLLILGGGQDGGGRVRPLFLWLAGGRQARVAVVPVASYLEDTGRYYCDILLSMGAAEAWVVDPEGPQADHPAVRQALEAASGIYLAGGDQKRLVRHLRGTLMVRCLGELLLRSTPVFVTSAATTALGDQMIAGYDEEDRPLLAPGLGLLPGVLLETHLTQRQREGRLRELMERRPGVLALGLDEDTALLLRPRSTVATVHGPGRVLVARQGRERRYRAGDAVDLAEFV
ncbi:MAG TPA: Type 1 glutamine amidotransferase-like domain-containing protein [Candidatus Nitrosotenuis sp.]|jgi:cyanophycinase|nr:Type 1 glutamine amidotransferase-like domain-containing protein [Candidatus Nitrosotenuis sp.]